MLARERAGIPLAGIGLEPTYYPLGVSRTRKAMTMATNEYQVTGMSCGHCEASVRGEVSKLDRRRADRRERRERPARDHLGARPLVGRRRASPPSTRPDTRRCGSDDARRTRRRSPPARTHRARDRRHDVRVVRRRASRRSSTGSTGSRHPSTTRPRRRVVTAPAGLRPAGAHRRGREDRLHRGAPRSPRHPPRARARGSRADLAAPAPDRRRSCCRCR